MTTFHIASLLYDLGASPDDDDWEVDFVSDRVRREVRDQRTGGYQGHIHKSFATFPESSRFAGWISELYAHRLLSGEFNAALPDRLLMATDDFDSPCFTFDPLRHDPVQATGAPLRHERIIVDFSQSLQGGPARHSILPASGAQPSVRVVYHQIRQGSRTRPSSRRRKNPIIRAQRTATRSSAIS